MLSRHFRKAFSSRSICSLLHDAELLAWRQDSTLTQLHARLHHSGAVASRFSGDFQAATTQQLSARGFVQPASADIFSEEEDEAVVTQPTKQRRSGLLAVKAGMTHAWDENGARTPLTVLWVDNCQVVQAKTHDRHGYSAVQLGSGAKRAKRMPAQQRGHLLEAGLPLKRRLAEFRHIEVHAAAGRHGALQRLAQVSEDALLEPGMELRTDHFVAGQYVDIQGTTIGKGYQGVMKRWGFSGQPASHGNTKAHRKAGGTGACQDPGKIWKGKKMAGRMGNKLRTVLSAWVYKVDPVRNLMWVRGQVPGHKGNFVKVEDAVMKTVRQQPARPFPAMTQHQTNAQVATGIRNVYDIRR